MDRYRFEEKRMEDNKMVVLNTGMICGVIFLIIASLVFRNYYLEKIEMQHDLIISQKRIESVNEMIQLGYNPIIAGCSFVDRGNSDFCRDAVKTEREKEIMDMINKSTKSNIPILKFKNELIK